MQFLHEGGRTVSSDEIRNSVGQLVDRERDLPRLRPALPALTALASQSDVLSDSDLYQRARRCVLNYLSPTTAGDSPYEQVAEADPLADTVARSIVDHCRHREHEG